MIYAFTGHRPDKLGGYDYFLHEGFDKYCYFTENKLKQLNPNKCISGMALGWDTVGAAVCAKLDIPWIAAIPFPKQESIWSPGDQSRYRLLCSKATETVYVSGHFSI